MSAYYATPGGPAAATGQEELAPVLVAFAGPARQSRLTVLIRLLMVIPHFIVLWALGIAAYVVVIIGWFGALFTGRLPTFAADFLAGFVRWETRVFGYTILLTDVYPPFTLEDADYPIRVAVRPGRLNRLAVLFRFILLIPAWIVASIVSYGALTIVQFVSWLIVLISGQMPDSLHQALSAVLRYQVRVIGFAFMLTSAYPAGLYGDPVTAGSALAASPQPGYGAFGVQPGQPGYGAQPEHGQQPGYGQQPEYGQQPGQPGHGAPGSQPGSADPQGWATQPPSDPQGWATQQQPAYGQQPGPGYPPEWVTQQRPAYGQQPPPEWPAQQQPTYGQQPPPEWPAQQPGYGTPPVATGPTSWWLVLSSRAKTLVTIFIVLGVLFAVGEGLLQAAVTGKAITSAEANQQLQADVSTVNSALANYRAQVKNCNTISCASGPNSTVAAAIDTFAEQVRTISMPTPQASADAANLASAASHLASLYSGLAAATTNNQYNTIASEVQSATNQVDQDLTNLTKVLTGS